MIYLNSFAIIIYLLSCIFLVKKHKRYLTLFGFVSLAQIWTLVSCFYNDLGIYNFELQYFTNPSYATTRLALFYVVFNIGFLLMGRFIGARNLTRSDYPLKGRPLQLGNLKLPIYVVSIAAIIYMFQSLSDIPLFTSIDRVTYLEAAGPLQQIIMNWGHFIVFGLGLLNRQGKFFTFPMIAFIAILIFSFFVGNKFSYPSALIIYFYTPIIMRYVTQHIDWSPFRAKYILYLAGVCIVFIAFAFGKYYDKLESIEGAELLIMDRVLANQGQMWWAIDQQVMSSDNDEFRSHWNDELDRIIKTEETPIEKAGMMYLMIKILGPKSAFAKLDSGYLFTMAYPAILVVTFPYAIAIIIQFIVGCMFFVLLFYIYHCVIYKHHYRALISFLILQPFITVLHTANFHVFFTVGMLIKISVLFFMEIYPQLYRLRQSKHIDENNEHKHRLPAPELHTINGQNKESK